MQVLGQGTWLQDTWLSCVALSVVLVQTQVSHLEEYTGEPGWAQGGAREAGEPRAWLGPHPPAPPPPPGRPLAHLVLGVPNHTDALGHWGERKDRGSDAQPRDGVGTGAWGGWDPPGGSPCTPRARSRHSPARRGLALAAPLTAGVEGAAPPGLHLALHVEAQRALRGLLLAQAGVALCGRGRSAGTTVTLPRGPVLSSSPRQHPLPAWPPGPSLQRPESVAPQLTEEVGSGPGRGLAR